MRGSVRQRMRDTGSFDHVAEHHGFPRVDVAVQSLLIRPAAPSRETPAAGRIRT
jgi:hypothetical protein